MQNDDNAITIFTALFTCPGPRCPHTSSRDLRLGNTELNKKRGKDPGPRLGKLTMVLIAGIPDGRAVSMYFQEQAVRSVPPEL